MSKAVSAEPNGTTAQTETDDQRPLTNDGIYGTLADLDWDGIPGVHRRQIRSLLDRLTDAEVQQFPVAFTDVSVGQNSFGETILTMKYDAGCVTEYDLEQAGIDLDRDSLQAWHDRTSVYLHTDE